MNFRNTAFLFGLLLGMLWLFGLMLAYKKIPTDATLVLTSLKPDSDAVIDDVLIKRKGKPELGIVKKDGDWQLQSGSTSVRMDTEQINKIIREIKDAARVEGADISLDPEKNGLRDPQVVVTLKGHTGAKKTKEKEEEEKPKGKEREWQISVGNPTADKSGLFVSSSDRPGKVLVVAANTLESLMFKDEAILRPTQLFAFNELSVKKVVVKEGKAEVELKKNDDESWRFVVPPMGFADFEGPQAPPKDPHQFAPKKDQPATGGVKGLIAKIRGLKVESESDFVPASADIKLSKYGLDSGQESLRIQMSAADEKKPEVLLVGGKVPDKDGYYFAHMQGDMGVFMLNGKQLAPLQELLSKPGELRSLAITFVDPKKVDMIKLTVAKEQLVLTHPDEKPWEMRIGDSKTESKVNEATIKTMLDAVEGKRDIQKFYDSPGADEKKLDAELGFDAPTAEIALFTESQPKKTKDEAKKDEKKEEKKETKPAVTLTFGKTDKESVPVKRVQQDGMVSRFALAKSVADKIVPPQGRIAFINTALPPLTSEDVAELIIERGSEKLEFVRGHGTGAGRWVFKLPGTEQPLADNEKIDSYIGGLCHFQASRWLHKIDEKKDDLTPYGLNAPLATMTLVLKKTTPAAAAGIVGLAGSPLGVTPFDTALGTIGLREAAKAETVTFRFGKESEDKDKPGSYALASTSDMLFLVATEYVKRLKSDDFRDRSMILAMQSILNAAALSAGPAAVLAESPILARVVNAVEPTKIKELRVELHQFDLRKFQFVRQAKPAEKDKGKEAPKTSEPPSVRGQTWQDQSGLVDFALDSEKINNLVEALAHLQAERIVTLTDGPKAEFKLEPKEAIVKIDATLESGQVLTLTIGNRFIPHGYYATSNAWPGAVFLLPAEFVVPYLRGAASFGKDRIAAE